MQNVDVDKIVRLTQEQAFDMISTSDLDKLSSEIAAYKGIEHPDYSILASRIETSNLHKNNDVYMKKGFSLYQFYHMLSQETTENGHFLQNFSTDFLNFLEKHDKELSSWIDWNRDYGFDFFGFRTLEKAYLLTSVSTSLKESPQMLFMRVAVGINMPDLDRIRKTYDYMSLKYFIHATPTLMNAGRRYNQLSSCFLIAMKDDSVEGIYDTLLNCAMISKFAGGIGLSIHNVRANDSYIRSVNGRSSGVVPMLRVFDQTARYVDQGGGKRKGAIAIYVEPWHAEIRAILKMRLNHGKDEERARDLFYALWVPDLFMKRVKNDEDWTLFCPDSAKGLSDLYGDEFEKLYISYEEKGMGRETIKAKALWVQIIDSQIETGTPYMLYKDHVNSKSNQSNLGVIKSSNLCTEIVQFTSKDEIAVCNLGSLSLPAFFDREKSDVDYEKLEEVVRFLTGNLDNVIDNNYYPVEEARVSNMRHRPMGIGVQGMADLFALMRISFDDEAALRTNRKIFECIYYSALKETIDMAKKKGPYETFQGSPLSKGILSFDMWETTRDGEVYEFNPAPKYYDFEELRRDVVKYGARNSLLVAPMPTASTAQIFGNNEIFEPFTSNLYLRRVLSGEFVCLNKHLVRDLIEEKLWTHETRQQIIKHNGSIQQIDKIPAWIKRVYRTIWEYNYKSIINLAIDRAPYVDQSQSLNVYCEQPDKQFLSSLHMYTWKHGLKTGMYYLRTKPAVQAIKFTLDNELLDNNEKDKQDLKDKEDAKVQK